ncbi:UPF0481 protein At3g47200-like [Pyrus x bretschneideri]|uniref:UPF0481 protein At3g47200-like n=1 Tax=Pyrus x bretschneideri TaxID=225117 RepID=UPI00203042FF|nr:UPF0481 protein At3g47200-like [Pyrus x bretschneideri]XP_048422331.1 UPF0481 protein At3g47200-like [Pyrus x bretschneideri]XP_048422332.1 UPF0481 protein At3g47200-like [Pyrus x bretschneideri]XP_048422333.1 UPF0481 protein At3g47200-like [Pyrus x bretschneideri]
MTNSAGESNANGDHSTIQVREDGERSEREISHAGNQILSGNEENEDSVIQVREGGERSEGETSHAGNQTLSGNEEDEDESFASQIKTELSVKRPELSPTCIFRVPKKLVRDNENVFVPQMVSIGPYHHGNKKLQHMEQIKQWYLQGLLDRKPTPETSLVKLVKEIRSREEFLRSCYDEKLDLNSYELVKMMVVDGCFIIRFLRMDNAFEDPGIDDPVFSVPGVYSAVKKDLLLLENQLPWKVVDCLFNLTAKPGDPSLHKFNISMSRLSYFFIRPHPTETREIRHFLDQLRDLLVGSSPLSTDHHDYWTPIPPVTHLEEIGVKFLVSDEKVPLNMTFDRENGVMEIPRTIIEVQTESVYRNLIAYEQCSARHHECRILSYAMIFNHLIKSTKDLDSLIHKQIIYTELSKEDTVSLFNRLCNDTERISFFYSQLTWQVNEYYEKRWLRHWLARIKNDYLYNPSSIWSLSNAIIIVLILTATQTVYSVLAYYKQKS